MRRLVLEWFLAKEVYVKSGSYFFCGNSVPILDNRGAGRRGRRRKQILDDLEETRGYWKFKEEALNNSLRRGYGPMMMMMMMMNGGFSFQNHLQRISEHSCPLPLTHPRETCEGCSLTCDVYCGSFCKLPPKNISSL